ncbi:MAG: GNAT family N-acetyltransferase [Erysipelotrichaceae bacterium]|nr:GNAT family N-acetyltransferase [Erysipelotrichaceae bacterium]
MELLVKRFNDLSNDELYAILKARVDIFVVEQNCPYEEIDDMDQEALHLYLKDNDRIKAYLRIIDCDDHAKIGRVIAIDRRKGLGTEIMNEAIRVCKQDLNKDRIALEAQTYVQEFYEKLGFRQASEPFYLDGIEHIKMIRE